MAMPTRPAGPGPGALFQAQRQLAPGARVRIGEHTVTIDRFLSQGGFARVYLVLADRAVPLPGQATSRELVLKHMCVCTEEALASVKAEVELHRKLRGHKPIVHFIEASASTSPTGWEIFMLMESCNGGGLIDFLNTRLKNRLDEREVLGIFQDICEGVSVLHHMQPRMVHRDLKIENILLSHADPPMFKLCDFGSCIEIVSDTVATTGAEMQACERDLNMHTTMQYRAPEMVNLRLQRPINEKADIWALGVLLYKLCYYTTPFEAPGAGAPAILAARYEFPAHPAYSSTLRDLIASMLMEDLTQRPTVDALKASVHTMLEQGVQCAPRGTDALRAKAGGTSAVRTQTPTLAPSSPCEVPSMDNAEDVQRRFPAVEDFEPVPARRSVRDIAASMSCAELPVPKPAMPARSNSDRVHRAPMPLLADSSEEETEPEDVEPMFHVRARGIQHVPGHAETSSPASTPAPAADKRAFVRAQVDAPHNGLACSDRAASLDTLLMQDDTIETASAPENEPSCSDAAKDHSVDSDTALAAQEKALEALLEPGMRTSLQQETQKEPIVGDLLGIKELSLTEAAKRAPAWEENDTNRDPLPKPSAVRVNSAKRSSTWDLASKPPPPKPKPKQYVDAATSPGLSPRVLSADPVEKEPFSPPAAVASPRGDATPSSKSPPAATHAVHALLSQRQGQVRLTKRPAQDATPKPWEKEAAARARLQHGMAAAQPETSASPEPQESFQGVGALIHQWQSRH
ncbi:non-specific serine/threonine protein kinase [Malassezia vespertilionis]|uniref:non-specific serine/threonine protein kinase n=1 Tax=Malassezia vespertilionis TaxID=2020962 RepID=A0A2N1J9R5_9BASI|nr:non-specific serine/threonine protein kinase [Malassezia vespertilionis]PKI83222.1 hypothetical protein MVES_002920 [Malassezia vespertilionis]WFD07709.1 non-specific serine/threonine protein kinase [Malassezia vespertilionis]